MSSPDNVSGGVIFVCYVLAPLILSPLILFDLGKASWKSHGRHRVATDYLQLATITTAVSFAMLSHHMLAFLVKYYNAWALRNRIYASQPYLELAKTLWPWLKGSTLFENFAQTICRGKARFWWTSSALMYSVGWSTYMATKGIERGVPKLWAYFLLVQILPTSYTQNVFTMALLLYPAPSNKDTKPLRSNPAKRLWTTLLMILTVVGFARSLWITKTKVGTGIFIPSVIFTRMLLIAPYVVTRVGGSSILPSSRSFTSPWIFTAVLGSAMSIWQIQSLLEDNRGNLVSTFKGILTALHDDPSVSALGYDFIIGISTLLVFWRLDVI